ncbi:hypothetical protein ACVWWO_005517 [Bradyrhizobium sp. F1.13.1]
MTGRGIRTSPDENQLRIVPTTSLHRKGGSKSAGSRKRCMTSGRSVIREGGVTRCYAGKGVVRYRW